MDKLPATAGESPEDPRLKNDTSDITSLPHEPPVAVTSDQGDVSTEEQAGYSHSSVRVSRYAILGLLLLVTIGVYPVIKIFIIPVILATTFTTLFFPLYKRLLLLFRGKRPLASITACLILFLCLVIPSYIVMHMVVIEMVRFYHSAEPMLKEAMEQGGDSRLFVAVRNFFPFRWLDSADINLVNLFGDTMKNLLSLTSKLINKTSAGFFGLFTTVIVMLFTMFYFFMDGEALVRKIKYLSPLRDDYEDLIIARFLLISRATVLGTVVIGITQGTFGAVTLLVFGIKSWLLWGVVMVFLSLIPMVGAWMVLIPAGIFQLITGSIWQGIGILVVSTLLISNIDNFIRPRLVGKEAKLHDLVIFFSSLGGIATFGVMGFIVGPVIAALFISVLDIYSTEFEQQLIEANRQQR
ncbi:MAG: AI-2E family transporter [Chitinispirillaceae bacterium]|nr:AI-2E family transporter [Chitinispirillaceae bacterium]